MSEPQVPATIVRRASPLRDGTGTAAGAAVAVAIHALVAVGVWLSDVGRRASVEREAAAQAAAQPQDEEIIEGALLRQGGGGAYDPRRVVHRQAPVRAEQQARPDPGLRPNPNPQPRVENPEWRPNVDQTQRTILGRGNQDLAERLQRMAQAENEATANAPPGPGGPDGSVHGTETDPNRAGRGAHAKIRSFLQNNLRLLATAPASARRPFRLRIVISADGTHIARGAIVQGSDDDTVDSDLNLQLAQLAENRTPIPELNDEEKAAIAGRSYVVRYVPD